MEKLSKPSFTLVEETGLGLPKRRTGAEAEIKPVPIAAFWRKERRLREGSDCFMVSLELAVKSS